MSATMFTGSLHPSKVTSEQPVSLCLWLLFAEKKNEKEAEVIRNVPEVFP